MKINCYWVGKVCSVFKENSNAVYFNFKIHLSNYIGDTLFHNLLPSFTQLEYSIFQYDFLCRPKN